MTDRRRIKVQIGLERKRATPLFPSEPRYVAQMNAQARAITDQLLGILDAAAEVSEDIMLEALQPTLEKAKYYCPKDTGDLVESAFLRVASFRGKPRVEMGFAKGGDPYYAIYVHEILHYAHEPPTRAKFLEAAVKEDLDEIYRRLNRGYWENLFA